MKDNSHQNTGGEEYWWNFPLRLCNTATWAYLLLRWLSTFLICNKLSCLSLFSLSLSLSPFLLPFTCFCVLLIYTPLSQCVSLSFTWELEVWNVMWCRADGQQSGVGCVWNRACLPMRGARPYFNPGFSGGAACSRWGHCTAPCINNSRRARESGGVCLPAQ